MGRVKSHTLDTVMANTSSVQVGITHWCAQGKWTAYLETGPGVILVGGPDANTEPAAVKALGKKLRDIAMAILSDEWEFRS